MADPVFSRPSLLVFTGKQTAVLKATCTDEVKEDFGRWWKARGYQSESACLLELVLVSMYGPEALADVHRKRIESLVRSTADAVPGTAR